MALLLLEAYDLWHLQGGCRRRYTHRISLRSSVQAQQLVPVHGLLSDSAFPVSGPMAWNGLPVVLRLTPVGHVALFLSGLKTKLLDRGWAGSAILKGLHIKLL